MFSLFRGVKVVGRGFGTRNMAAVGNRNNFNSKHLKKGDPLPPYNGKLRVYNMRFCPFAQRTILALNAKNIDYEIINVNLAEKPEWLASKSPFTKVPAIEVADGVSVYESLVTVEYLDDIYPQRPLLPKDPLLKAKDKIIVEAMGPVQSLFIKLVKFSDTITDEVFASYFKALDYVQGELIERGSKFLDGEQPGYADYMIWPWFERVLALDSDKAKMDEQKYKVLLAYIQSMLQDPIVSEYLIPKQVFEEFHASFAEGKAPNYGLLNKNVSSVL